MSKRQSANCAVAPARASQAGRDLHPVRPSLFMAPGWFRVVLGLLVTGVIWSLVLAVVAG